MVKDLDQPVNGEPLQFDVADAGEFRRGNARQIFRLDDRKAKIIKNTYDFCCKFPLEIQDLRIRAGKVSENILGSVYQLEIIIFIR